MAKERKARASTAARTKIPEPAVFVLLSYIKDWESGWWSSDVANSSTHNDGSGAMAAFLSHQSALDAQAGRELATVPQGAVEETYDQEFGFEVINVLFRVPLAHRTADDPPSWELLEDNFDYVIADGSYSMELSSGSPKGLRGQGHVADVDLTKYLPPADSWPRGKATGRKPTKRVKPVRAIPTLRDAQLAADRVRFMPPASHPLATWHRLNHYGYLAGIAMAAGDTVTHDRLRHWLKTRVYDHDAARARKRLQGDDDSGE